MYNLPSVFCWGFPSCLHLMPLQSAWSCWRFLLTSFLERILPRIECRGLRGTRLCTGLRSRAVLRKEKHRQHTRKAAEGTAVKGALPRLFCVNSQLIKCPQYGALKGCSWVPFRAHGEHLQGQAPKGSAKPEAHSTSPAVLPAPRPKAGTARSARGLCPGRVPGWWDEPPGDAVLPTLREGLLQGKAPPLPGSAVQPRRTHSLPVPRSGRSPPAHPRAGQVQRSVAALGEKSCQRPALSSRPVPPSRAVPGTGELLDGEPVEDLEGGIELQRLAAALAHKADLRSAGRRTSALHAVPLHSTQPRARTAAIASAGRDAPPGTVLPGV